MECARQYTEAEFHDHYSRMELKYPAVTDYLERRVEVSKWAKCYFPAERYNLYTSNVVESLNSVFKYARKLPLLPMIDAIVEKLCEWFNKHRNEAPSTPPGRKLIEYSVLGFDGINYTVSLKNKTCSCKLFDIDKYLCVHALAALEAYMKRPDREVDINVEDLCSMYYLTEQRAFAYNRTIYHVPHKSQWVVPDDVNQLSALPPVYELKRGAKQHYFTGGENAGSENAGGENGGSENAGGENGGGENAGSENARGENARSENAGGENAGGENAGGGVSGDNVV
ncbi:uncharacterized protein LOC112089833 [Eutrema salsugineum]|uniref:uncharacterized protein LOC112089833 n=1 Tax=Eutrema salsugineum TaxID=72664 RepID=UPI000CED2BE4|nr:uncharacterized protein LOC112089833 [Eutrema salsugineum]